MKGLDEACCFQGRKIYPWAVSISGRLLQMGGGGKEGEQESKGKTCSVSSWLDKRLPLWQVYFVILS